MQTAISGAIDWCIVLAFAVTVVVSLLTKRPSDEIVAEFDRVEAV